MVLRAALEQSSVGAATRPYEEGSTNRIILIGGTQDVYVADAQGNYVRDVTEEDRFRVVGHDDWEPVGVKGDGD